ncbi:MAG TPA: nuclear transport factor 2 family protein [Acidimicrobiia bacterium]|nr:nuclear transport factor 2 family protein [Acidimicrobiia bacterium]
MDERTARVWVDSLGQAWCTRNPRAVGDLFAEHAVYRSDPFRPALVGRTAIVEYWAEATRSQSGISVSFGDPLVQGDRVAVEWWSILNEDGQPSTEAGGLFLAFDNGLCTELREYWNVTPQAVTVSEGWGQ